MNLEEIKDRVEYLAPEFLGKVRVLPSEVEENKINLEVHFDFASTNWVKIDGDGTIDVSCPMRVDWEFAGSDANEEFVDSIAGIFYSQAEIDVADLALTPVTNGLEADPLLTSFADGARLLPRDLVRNLIRTAPNAFAGKVAEDSSFREEDWFKEWESDVASESKKEYDEG